MSTCKQCNIGFEITPEELRLYQKFNAEPTGFCFDCDHKNRLCFRNERVLYNRKCDATGESIISIYSPDRPYKVYKNEAWYGDGWDALEFGQEVDFSRPFFEQLKELQLKVPRPALVNLKGENSDYCNMCVGNKNCYLVFGGDFNEDVYYGTLCMHNKSSMDIDNSGRNELCYMVGDSADCYECQFIFNSKNCRNCAFVSDSAGCTECILCTNLVNKSYCIENVQLTKEEYFAKKKEIVQGTHSAQQILFAKFIKLLGQRIVKYANIIGCQDCTGDYIYNSKNCHNCFDTSECEDSRNVIFGYHGKDIFNSDYIGHGSELCYNQISVMDTSNAKLSYYTYACSNVTYCDIAENSHDCFGCVGIRGKRHCILNKQYSKEDYEKLVQKIIEHMKKTGEWGQFLAKNLSCFGYNESTAQQFYPLTKKQALAEGFNWVDLVIPKPEAKKVISAKQLPDNISDIPDDIVNWAIRCEKSDKPFKITPQELKFYRQNNLPIPHLHSEERHTLRQSLRTPHKLWNRKCQKCGVEIQTSYSPDRSEIVYCEKCYLETVY